METTKFGQLVEVRGAYKDFRGEHQPASIHYSFSLGSGYKGSIEETEQFIKDLQAAVEYVKELNK